MPTPIGRPGHGPPADGADPAATAAGETTIPRIGSGRHPNYSSAG